MSWLHDNQFFLLYHGLHNEERAKLNNVANSLALYIGDWICK